MTQPSFFDRTIQQRYEEFHAEHPEVLDALLLFARHVKATGVKSYGIRAIWERMRWHFRIEKGNNEFKLNDHFTSRYARYIMEQYPEEFGDFFELRELKAE